MECTNFKLSGRLIILSSVIGVLSGIMLMSDECAAKDKPFTLWTNCTDPFFHILWKRTDKSGEITLSASGVMLPSPGYNLSRYTFQCNHTQKYYSMEINNVQEEDRDSNWSITITTSSDPYTSNNLQIKICETDEPKVPTQNDQNGLSHEGKIGIGVGVVALVVLFAGLIVFCKISHRRNRSRGCNYKVNITTGVRKCQSSPSSAWIEIVGDKEQKTGKRWLYDKDGNGFDPGKTKTFSINAAAVGKIKTILLGCDSCSSTTSGWFVEEVVIEVSEKYYVSIFDCYIPSNENGEQREVDEQTGTTNTLLESLIDFGQEADTPDMSLLGTSLKSTVEQDKHARKNFDDIPTQNSLYRPLPDPPASRIEKKKTTKKKEQKKHEET